MADKNQTLDERVKAIIEEIRPHVQMDGGDIEFVKVEGKNVYLRLHGACCGCPSSQMTLKLGIQRRIQEEIPEVEDVIAV
ncbi:MAG TPA: NifU family protein [Bdellovibrionota bacterium]|nr:NifU family protein [Bdellovibrionota bacterium]